MAPYAAAFEAEKTPFLHDWRICADKSLAARVYTRGDLWRLATRAAGALARRGIGRGDYCLHCFSANRLEDLAFRLAAAIVGSVPVTVNWQADDLDQARYKAALTGAKLAIHDDGYPRDFLAALSHATASDPLDATGLREEAPIDWETGACADLGPDDPKIVIFTSGTTGRPKGALHGYRSYEANRRTFDRFLGFEDGQRFALVSVNPLHHANATALTDWCFRHPGAELHLVERYTTHYWQALADIAAMGNRRVIAPATARHFDFLHELMSAGRLAIGERAFRAAMASVTFLVGSAPVGPTAVSRIQRYAGKLPVVRFGSTETCLQAIGTPSGLSEAALSRAFERGWRRGQDGIGYYIGRPHPPVTEACVVASVDPDSDDFLRPRPEGAPGYLAIRGDNVMSGYVNQPQETRRVLRDGWYLGLMDVGFWLRNESDGEADFYWMSRESNLLIRGGANYAYEQINRELKALIVGETGLAEAELEIAVVGVKLESEHEDACCVTIELRQDCPARERQVREALTGRAAERLSKGARPDRIRFGAIPRNFKGAVLTGELKKAFVAP